MKGFFHNVLALTPSQNTKFGQKITQSNKFYLEYQKKSVNDFVLMFYYVVLNFM